ncbi:MAG: DUF445 domain-containing protein [Chitinophagaceae bacterium]|nr:DUF445 domain-containing protein [Chitinophagaceae bacterium]
MPYPWILVPALSACIGWTLARMMTGLLFYPANPRKILGITLQGVVPKKQRQLSGQLAAWAAKEMISFPEFAERIADPANVQRIMPQVDEHIDRFLKIKLPEQMPVIGMFIGDKTVAELKALFIKEMEALFPVVMKGYMGKLEDQLDLEQIISAKLSGLSPDRLERALRPVMAGPRRVIGIAGAMLGLIIGLLAVVMSAL